MKIELTIPDEQAERVIDALAAGWEYEREGQDGESKTAFVKRMLKNLIRRKVVAAERNALPYAAMPDVE